MEYGLKMVEKQYSKTGNIVEDVIQGYGVDIEKLVNPEKFVIPTNSMNIDGMERAVKIFLETIENKGKIAILIDDDADGFVSAAIMTKVLYQFYDRDDVEWVFHNTKSHGLGVFSKEELDEISENSLLIIPDAASNDFEEIQYLLNKDLKLIIVDHHNVDNQDLLEDFKMAYPNFAIVNNQLKENKDRNINSEFTGAGMVFKFYEAIHQHLGKNNFISPDELLDLVAIGQIGDASDISNYEIRLLVNKGINNINSKFIKTSIGEDNLTPKSFSFSIIPTINAITRVGTMDEKIKMMKALSDYWNDDEKVIVERRRKNKITGKMDKVQLEWSHYELADDELKKVKARQNKIVDKLIKGLDDVFIEKICIIETTEEEIQNRSITGLVANKLVSKYLAPTLVLVESKDGKVYNGSGRGFEKLLKDFRQWCLDTGRFNVAQGHDNAFGVEIEKEELDALKEYLAETNLESGEVVYEVDKIYENDSNLDEVRIVNDSEYIFGGKIKSPMFGYKSLVISRNSIHQRGSVVTFFHQGLEFIAYKQPLGLVDDFISKLGFKQHIMVDLVGSPSRNNWQGRIKEQIVLEDFVIFEDFNEVVETPEDSFLDANGNLSF